MQDSQHGVKSLKKYAFGITSLRENGILKQTLKKKLIFATGNSNLPSGVRQILTRPQKGLVHSPPCGEITVEWVDPKGVSKLLDGLNVHKAPSTGGLNAKVLKQCSTQISPILALIYNESLAQCYVTDDWRHANASPVFKKGEKYDAANYTDRCP